MVDSRPGQGHEAQVRCYAITHASTYMYMQNMYLYNLIQKHIYSYVHVIVLPDC